MRKQRSTWRDIDRLKSRDAGVRAAAALRIGIAGDRSAVEALKASAADPSAEVRMRVIEALGSLGEGSSEEVINAIGDRDELVRVQATEELSIRTPKSIRLLHSALRDPSWLVRSYAAAALGRIGRPREKAVLYKALRLERNQNGRLGYYEALWMLGETDALNSVEGLLDDRDYRTRLAAAKALASTFLSSGTQKRIRILLRARQAAEKNRNMKSAMDRLLREIATTADYRRTSRDRAPDRQLSKKRR